MQGNLQQGRNQGATTSASPLTPSNSSHHLARPLLINAVLSFIKVCRLKGDVGDDILQSFVALDSSNFIPGIYCEATDLLRVPSLSLDPISETVEMNTLSLQELASKIDLFEAKIPRLLEAGGAPCQATFAAVASSNVTVPPSADTNTFILKKSRVAVARSPPTTHSLDCNLILFGLPRQLLTQGIC